MKDQNVIALYDSPQTAAIVLPWARHFAEHLNHKGLVEMHLSADTDMIMKLRIMRAMGLFYSRGAVTVLMNCPTQTKQQLQRHISWYRSFSAQVGLGQFVVKDEAVGEVRNALTKITDKRTVLQTFQI